MTYKKIDFKKMEKDNEEILTIFHKIKSSWPNKLFWPIVLVSTIIGISGGIIAAIILFLLSFLIMNLIVRRSDKEGAKELPSYTPINVLENITGASDDNIILELYKEQITIQTGEIISGTEYKVLGYITSDISLDDFLLKALAFKADLITGFSSTSTISNEVSSGILTPNHIKTKTTKHEKFQGTAIEILNSKQEMTSVNINEKVLNTSVANELEKIADLKDRGFLSDEEFADAKMKILQT